jgi:hypothetical protein
VKRLQGFVLHPLVKSGRLAEVATVHIRRETAMSFHVPGRLALYGGRHRTRTCDPCGVIAVLYQLS